MIGALSNHVQSGVAGDVQQIGLFHAVRDGQCPVIGAAAVVGQRLGLVRHTQQVAQQRVRLVHAGQRGVNVDKGDIGLLLQGVQILHDAALGLAHVDDHLRAALQQRLQIQLALAAVQLSQQGQVIVFRVQILRRALVPGVGNAHQLVGAQGEQHDLGHGAGHGHLIDLSRHRHLTANGIGEHTGLRGGILVLREGFLGAAGGQAQGHHQRQQQRQQSLRLFHLSSPFRSFGISHASHRSRPKRRFWGR